MISALGGTRTPNLLIVNRRGEIRELAPDQAIHAVLAKGPCASVCLIVRGCAYGFVRIRQVSVWWQARCRYDLGWTDDLLVALVDGAPASAGHVAGGDAAASPLPRSPPTSSPSSGTPARPPADTYVHRDRLPCRLT